MFSRVCALAHLRRRAAPTLLAHPSNFASIVIRAFSSFDTGHPALALLAISWNFALSAPGILADTVRWLAVISKAVERAKKVRPKPHRSDCMQTTCQRGYFPYADLAEFTQLADIAPSGSPGMTDRNYAEVVGR